MKRSHELDDLDAEAEVAYEDTRLARDAPRARARVGALCFLGALATILLGTLAHQYGWSFAALALAITGVGVRRGSLAALVAAGLVALVAVLLPLALAGVGMTRAWLPVATSVVLGAAALPDIIRLARDAELQHAYGKWARR